eukprot:722335_1
MGSCCSKSEGADINTKKRNTDTVSETEDSSSAVTTDLELDEVHRVTATELGNFVLSNMNKKTLNHLWKHLDEDGSGEIERREVLTILQWMSVLYVTWRFKQNGGVGKPKIDKKKLKLQFVPVNDWIILHKMDSKSGVKKTELCKVFGNWLLEYDQIKLINELNELKRKMYVLKNAIADKTEDVIYSPKEGQKPQYFMHVTAVDEDVFHMNVVADVPADCTRKLFIKDMNHLENTRIIKIKKGETSQGIDMVIRKSDPCKCRFAIYASRESAQPISNATQLQLTVLKDENEMPPKNMQYKPKCIDAAAAFQVKDVQNNQLNIYWSISPKAFGNISYKIVVNHREIAIISALPYYVPLSSVFSVFTSPFQVITVSEAEGFIYESNPSDPIYCHDLKKKEDEKEDEKVRESAETVKEEYDPYDLDEKAFGRFIIEKVNEKTANRLMQHLKTGKNKVCDDKVIKPK